MTLQNEDLSLKSSIDGTLLGLLDESELRRIAEDPMHTLFYEAQEELWRRCSQKLSACDGFFQISARHVD